MNLALLQRELARLVATGQRDPAAPPDAYLDAVRASPGLEAVRDIAVSWNAYTLEQVCPLTTRILRIQGTFDVSVAAISTSSPFAEDLALEFLARQVAGGPDLVADVARFEAAVLRSAARGHGRMVVEWHYDPDAVVRALLAGADPGDLAPLDRPCRTVVSPDLPNLFARCD